MKITFLGTGTSQGIPVIACNCEVCTSEDRKDKRLRTSILVEFSGKSFVIDSGPDFRYQMLRAQVKSIDGIIFTHEHKDHIAGLDDVRAFNFKHEKEIDIYAEERVLKAIRNEFAYIFSGSNYPGIPRVKEVLIENKPFTAAGIPIIPIRALHYKLPILGFRFDDFVYLTDLKTITEEEKQKIRGAKTLVLSALRKEEHISHLTLQEAIALASDLQVEKCYLTHLSHQMGKHTEVEKELPPGIFIAYDNLELEL